MSKDSKKWFDMWLDVGQNAQSVHGWLKLCQRAAARWQSWIGHLKSQQIQLKSASVDFQERRYRARPNRLQLLAKLQLVDRIETKTHHFATENIMLGRRGRRFRASFPRLLD